MKKSVVGMDKLKGLRKDMHKWGRHVVTPPQTNPLLGLDTVSFYSNPLAAFSLCESTFSGMFAPPVCCGTKVPQLSSVKGEGGEVNQEIQDVDPAPRALW